MTLPQQKYYNPALCTTYTFYISIPTLSYINVAFSNRLSFDDILHKRDYDDSLEINLSDIISKLKKNNLLSFDYHHELISAGFRIKKNIFNFNITEHASVRFNYPQDLIKLLNGNAQFYNNNTPADISNLKINAVHYRDYSIGYTRIINNKLIAGISLKYLNGGENIWVEKNKILLQIEDTAITATTNYKINSSIPEEFDTKHFINSKNVGFAFDIGAQYKINSKISVAASFIDIGSIKWKENAKNFSSNNTFTFKGVDFNDIFGPESQTNNNNTNIDNNSTFNNYFDSIANTFNPVETKESYKAPIPKKIYISSSYIFNDKNTISIMLRNEFVNNITVPSMTLQYIHNFGKIFALTSSYSIYNRNANNIGLGYVLNLGAFQFYTITDNILPLITSINKTKYLNIAFGFNLSFKSKESKDKLSI